MPDAPFAHCKTAELQFGAEVQSFGGLIAIDKRTQRICACSANAREFTGKTPQELLDRHWSLVFQRAEVSSLFMAADAPGQELPHIQPAELHERPLLIANHSVGHMTIAELEPYVADHPRFDFADRAAYLHALADTDTPEHAAKLLMKTVAEATQYDRVMLYRFLPGWHGEVIAESLKPGIHGFLGLRFPASDIPANARRLYLVNRQRIIVDVNAETVPIVAVPGSDRLDFSFSQLRAVHPVHIQYLKNIGVEASFSVSIVAAGKLWGMLACHHMAPKAVSLNQRQYCEEIARSTGIHMADMTATQLERTRANFRESLAEILGALRADGSKRAIISQLMRIRRLFRCQGILAHLDGQDFHAGDVPDEISLRALCNWLENYDKSAIAAGTRIGAALATYPALVRFASGILYVPLRSRDFLLAMRPEQVETVSWAGKPQSQSDDGAAIAELTPRASFQIWSEQVKGLSEPWTEAEIESASRLREMLIDYIERIQLESMALRDPLTGLPNRLMFERALREAIKQAIKTEALSAIFMLDLDKFKPVNDTLGHAAGDELLIEVGRRLTAMMRSRDAVARLGGDEFAIVQYGLRGPADAYATAVRILEEMRRPFIISGQSVEIGVSIGVSMCPINAIEHNELLENADLALYQAKLAGRNTFKSFTDTMVSDKDQKESVRQSIADAIDNGGLWLAYQPVVSSKTKVLHSFEAFARWTHPVRGELAARDFLPLIEQCHLTVQFAEWSIRAVLQQGKLWMRKGLPLVPVSVNISARQFLNLDLIGLCTALAREIEIGLEWLRLDLDEMALQSDFQRAIEKIAALAEVGILTNIDHFGQGLVSLSRIIDVKINQLKITNGFFGGGIESIKNDAMVAVIRSIGSVMNVPIVATQIETPAMELLVILSGIEYLQGRQFCQPLPPSEVDGYLSNKARH